MTKIIDSSYLKVTSNEDGNIWIIDGDKMPKKVSSSPEEFIGDVMGSDKHKFVRVLASPVNYNLITKLCGLKAKGQIESLQIATPSLMQSKRPESSLLRMRLCTLPASLGGFHESTTDDFAIYTMARLARVLKTVELKIESCKGKVPIKVRNEHSKVVLAMTEAVTNHSVWPYLSFIDSIDPVIAGVVLASIGDPRWFINPDRPDRLSKLYSWMGLSGDRSCPDKVYRKNTIMLCWYGGNMGGFREYENFPVIIKDKIKDPNFFVIKYAHDRWGVDWTKWPRNMVSKYLLRFIRLSWLDCIYPYPNPWMEPLFDYSTFFKSNSHLKEFKDFIKK